MSLYLPDSKSGFRLYIHRGCRPTLKVKIEFSQRALNLIGRPVGREHLINGIRTLTSAPRRPGMLPILGRIF
jgi:hypothetical protein